VKLAGRAKEGNEKRLGIRGKSLLIGGSITQGFH